MRLKGLVRALVAAGALSLGLVPAVASAQGKGEQPGVEAPQKGKPGKQDRKGKKGKGSPELKAAREYVEGNMRLADAYLVRGDWGEAVNHFQAVIDFKPDLKKLAASAGVDPEKIDAAKKRRGKGGPLQKLHKVKLRAYMGAAAASQRMGDTKGAKAFAQAGLTYADANNLERGVERFERFLADPAKEAVKIAPDVEVLEERIEEARKALPK